MDWNSILTFKTMISPLLIQILFWIGVVACVISGVGLIFSGEFGPGLAMILLGPLLVRVYAEMLIVMFKINEGVQALNAKK